MCAVRACEVRVGGCVHFVEDGDAFVDQVCVCYLAHAPQELQQELSNRRAQSYPWRTAHCSSLRTHKHKPR